MTDFDHTNRFGTADMDPAPPTAECELDGKGPEAVDRLMADLRTLRDHVSTYLTARQDQVKLGVRRVVIGLLVGLLALLVSGTILITASVLLVAGTAAGLGELFGQRLWLGELITAVAILALAALGTKLCVQSLTRTSRWRTINRYAKRYKQQQESRRPAESKPSPAAVGK